jgi:hypothetical protein
MPSMQQVKRDLRLASAQERWRWGVVRGMTALAVVTALAVATVGVVACSSSAQPPVSSSATSAQPPGDVGPAGDIPDNQAFVTFTAPDHSFSVKVPEGWSKIDTRGVVEFTDKLNSITIGSRPSVVAPTPDSVKAQVVPSIAASTTGFRPGDVSLVDRHAGQAILLTYGSDSPPNPVTGKVVVQSVQRYVFYRAGVEVAITLSAPAGADNVDPWRTVTDSFAWLP